MDPTLVTTHGPQGVTMAKFGSTGASSADEPAEDCRVAVDGDGAVAEGSREVEGAGDEPDERQPGEGERGDVARAAAVTVRWLRAPLRSSVR